ncbi:tyrosine-type recombinase/integrase [Pelomonas sp. CA6]|uniref:tyrosine-type recombinase/integrase n=1 Tax=Pelomonas sp. CA6 TaxID=2907999 RepID=UPI001F4BD398|nr:site-specific integrase [Pelomonas sp. CA6]MCH7343945.1 tyrosine-type recombinase/integrase [Pelomonas sp. CA6]
MTRYPRQGKGRRWTVKELEAISPEWKGDKLADGDGLVGTVRGGSGDHVSVHFSYAFKWEGKVTWFYCGTWPVSTLEAIRAERDRARALVKEGIKPTDAKRAAKIEAQAKIVATIAEAARKEAENLPVRAMFDAWMQDGVKRADGNAELRRSFEKDVLPLIGDKAVSSIEEADIRGVLRAIISRGTYRMASRIHADMVQLFAWAEDRKPWRALMVEGNPTKLVELSKLLPHGCNPDVERDRVLSADELRELRTKLADMESNYAAAPAGTKYSVDRPLKRETQLALWICLGTLCRIGELLMSRWEHLNLLAGEWTIPRENTKTGVELKVYLSPFALRHFKELHALTGDTPFCFPARAAAGEEPAQHVCVKSVSKQIGDRQTQFKKRAGPLTHRKHDNSLVLSDGRAGEWTPHDLRRTGATMMQQLGVSLDVIDRCQNHVLAGGRVRRAYLHHDYATEKRDAWNRLGERIETLLDSPNVVPFAIRRA